MTSNNVYQPTFDTGLQEPWRNEFDDFTNTQLQDLEIRSQPVSLEYNDVRSVTLKDFLNLVVAQIKNSRWVNFT
jgi:hypothetical protein